MKVTEQIEAMEVSSTNPMRFLVVTRVLAATLMIPLLILYADLCGEGIVINSCIIKRENNHWEGDLLIPDSLETGIYLFRVYTGNYDGKSEVATKLLTVINRFGNNKTNELRKLELGYKPLDLIRQIPENAGAAINIQSRSSEFPANSTINLSIEQNSDKLSSGISLSVYKIPDEVVASESQLNAESEVVHSTLRQTKIFNKLTLTGKIVDKESREPVAGETVLFSVPDTIPQINYAITEADGEFLFEVDGYYGTQNVILQTLSKDRKLEIILHPNLLEPPLKIPFYLSEELEKSEFVTLSVKRTIVSNAYNVTEVTAKTTTSFKYPFYGKPSNIVIPDRYVDLNDFEEINKELLPLCRIKKEKNSATLKIYDPDNFITFESPWVIVDGVPVFDIKLLFPFNSQKILRIETQTQTRCYGGLYIDGALSVFTREGNYANLPLPVNAIRNEFSTFHHQQEYVNWDGKKESLFPDFRDVLYWNPDVAPTSGENTQTVQGSCEKGNYVAIAQAMDEDGIIYRSVYRFVVK